VVPAALVLNPFGSRGISPASSGTLQDGQGARRHHRVRRRAHLPTPALGGSHKPSRCPRIERTSSGSLRWVERIRAVGITVPFRKTVSHYSPSGLPRESWGFFFGVQVRNGSLVVWLCWCTCEPTVCARRKQQLGPPPAGRCYISAVNPTTPLLPASPRCHFRASRASSSVR
jgi:hypothetical protein